MARTKWARSAIYSNRPRRSRSGNRSRKLSATTREIEEETETGARRTIGTTGSNPTPSTTMIQTSGLVHFGKRNYQLLIIFGIDFQKKLLSAGFVPARPQSSTTRRLPPTTTTRRPHPPTTTTTRRPPPRTTTTRAPPPPPRQQQLKQQQPQQQQQQQQQQPAANQNSDYAADFDYYGDGELSSDEYSYLYYQDYYDELVPKHHRFDNKNKTSNAAPSATAAANGKSERKDKSIKTSKGNGNSDGSFNVFVVSSELRIAIMLLLNVYLLLVAVTAEGLLPQLPQQTCATEQPAEQAPK